MRYLIYTETFPSRRPDDSRQTGVGRYCADLASGLAALGHGVTVLTNDGIGAAVDSSPEPFRVEVLGPVPNGRRAMAVRAREVLRRARAGAPDFVLVGDPAGHAALSATFRRAAAPVCPILYGTELVAWREAVESGRSPRALLRRWRLRRYLTAGAVPICISRFTAGLLRRLLPASSDECIVYPCVSGIFLTQPVDRAFRDELRRRVSRDGTTPLILTTVARISERKNQLGVLQALERLRQSAGPAWHYLVVGNLDAPEHETYFARLRAFTAERGLAEQVTFVHHATDAQKVDYLDACDASAMLSRSAGASVEGFGISVIEAAVRGKPALVSDQGGMPETIVEGVTGFAVPPDDVTRIAGALQTLASDPKLRSAMGERGRRRTLEQFTPTAAAARLHAQLLERRSFPRPVRASGPAAPALESRGGQEF
jgi:glycosyltransferase involved in cell wall biosynthesis